MNKQEIETRKAEFIELLKSTGREGIDDLIDMLDDGKMHFFTAPASVNHHLNSDGGLLIHSLNTCKAGLKLRDMLHDICKADIYVPAIKKRKGEDGIWREVESYDVSYRNFPMGHGEKSAMLALMSGLEIYDDELLAIRWHMAAWDLPMQSIELNKCINTARDEHPLCSLVNLADGMAANLMEWE